MVMLPATLFGRSLLFLTFFCTAIKYDVLLPTTDAWIIFQKEQVNATGRPTT